MEQTLVADGPSPEPCPLLDQHVDGSHGITILGKPGREFVEVQGSVRTEVMGGQKARRAA